MATQVYNEEEVVLQDGTEVVLRPLNIGRLRRLMKAWKEFEKLEDDDDSFEIFINCSGIALEHEFKERFEALQGKGKEGVLNPAYRDYLEEVLDMDTIYKIMDVCAGLKLTDPNLLAAAARAAEGGTN